MKTIIVTCGVVLFLASSAQSQEYHGAITYSPSTGSKGYSYNYSSRSTAENRALSECGQSSGASDCRVLIWFRDACGALSEASNGSYGSGWGTNRQIAENYAYDVCRNNGGSNCAITRWVCSVGSTANITGGSTVKRDKYGAIAYSSGTGAHGFSNDYGSRSDAETRALNECQQFARRGDCSVLIWFRNACGALAVASNNVYGSGWGDDRSIAENQALQSCRNYGGNGCHITQWVCTDR